MKSISIKLCALLLCVGASSVFAGGKIPVCKSVIPAEEREDYRDAKVEAVAGRGTVFNNNEKLLPAAGKNETYREYDLGMNQAGGRGAHRLVLLVLGGEKNQVLDQYYTDTHYSSFCEVRQ